MNGTPTPAQRCRPASAARNSRQRNSRPAWRQRWFDAERGAMHGIRGDSAFFVYFFLSSVTLVASAVLAISLVQWTIVILALTLVLSAEMFNEALKSILACVERPLEQPARAALRMATAAVYVAIIGAVLVIGLNLGDAALRMFEAADVTRAASRLRRYSPSGQLEATGWSAQAPVFSRESAWSAAKCCAASGRRGRQHRSRLACRRSQQLEEFRVFQQPAASTAEQQSSGAHKLHGQAVEIEVFGASFVGARVAAANQLGRIEYDDVVLPAVAQHVAMYAKASACTKFTRHLIQMRDSAPPSGAALRPDRSRSRRSHCRVFWPGRQKPRCSSTNRGPIARRTIQPTACGFRG